MSDYSMWLVEYGYCTTQAVSSLVFGRHNAGIRTIPFSFLVLKGKDHLVAVDTGYYDEGYAHELTVRFGVDRVKPIETALQEIGIRGEDVDTVIITHAHYDHMGGIKAFPKAHFYLQQTELLEWIKVLALPPRFDFLSAAIDPGDVKNVIELMAQKRLTLVDGPVTDLLPGISVFPAYESHTYGLQLVTIDDTDERGEPSPWVFTSDAAYSFENFGPEGTFDSYSPVGFGVGSLTGMVGSLETIRKLARGRIDRLIIPHDAAMWRRFPTAGTSDGMHVAEIRLHAGEKTRL